MTFAEAEQNYRWLEGELAAGKVSREEYSAKIAALRLQDEKGIWWQISENGRWLYWNGNEWLEYQNQSLNQSHNNNSQQSFSDSVYSAAQGLSQNTMLQQMQRYAVNPMAFIAEFRHIPWMKRPQIWWDTVSVMGGAVAGVLWFIYSGIRGLREGFDWLTVIIMVGLPIFLALFRTQLDKLLVPLQQYRARVPRLVLLGIGLALPLLVANITYVFFSEYSYLHVNLIMGTILSYLVFRNPVRG